MKIALKYIYTYSQNKNIIIKLIKNYLKNAFKNLVDSTCL